MKSYLESEMQNYPGIHPTPSRVLEHMFSVNGNGVGLDNKGWLGWDRAEGEAYPFGDPSLWPASTLGLRVKSINLSESWQGVEM